MNFVWFLLSLAVGTVGGLIGHRLKIPAGPLLGAMVFTALFNLATDQVYVYGFVRTVLLILTGVMVGGHLTRRDVAQLRKIVLPTLIMLAGMVIMNLCCGLAIYLLSGLDLVTALFSTAPGGVTDIVVVSEEFGANTAYVAVLHFVRIFVIFFVMPTAIKKISARHPAPREEGPVSAPAAADGPGDPHRLTRFVLVLFLAAGGGLAFKALNVPAGALMGSMVVSALVSLFWKPVLLPSAVRIGLMICSGVYIGASFDRSSAAQLPHLAVPLFIVSVGVILFALGTGFLVWKLGKLDILTSLLASTPSGVQEMTLLAEELGGNAGQVAVMHTVRLIFIVAIIPSLISVITGLVS